MISLLKEWTSGQQAAGIVYHVANPDIRGRIVKKANMIGHVGVEFEREVEFSGNPGRKEKYWECSKHLLFTTSEEAWKNKKY